ncbi:MAG: amino acid ABC transporter permease [Actinomycetota bacterium]|nr:amino acid ABC transporter permease [Actinomycetota bacterium]
MPLEPGLLGFFLSDLWDSTDTLRTQYFDLSILSDNDWENAKGVLEGFWETIQLSVLSGVLALAWGLVLAVLRQLPGRPLAPVRWLTIAYIDVFRGIPLLLVLLLVSGSLGALAFENVIPESIGIPRWFGKPDPFWYGIIALTVTYGAYMAEVYRAGIEAVPHGQMEAARSLGMSHGEAMRQVIVPQAVRKVIPPLLNDFIALMKDTSLVSVIGFVEVVQFGRDVQSETFNSTALTFGAVLFLLVTIPMARLVDRMIARQQERTSRGGGPAEPAPAGAAGMGQTGGPV